MAADVVQTFRRLVNGVWCFMLVFSWKTHVIF